MLNPVFITNVCNDGGDVVEVRKDGDDVVADHNDGSVVEVRKDGGSVVAEVRKDGHIHDGIHGDSLDVLLCKVAASPSV